MINFNSGVSANFGHQKNLKQKNTSFGRALTTAEKARYTNLITRARDTLDIQTTAMIAFDVSVGSYLSTNAHKFFKFMKDMTGANMLQDGPQGGIEKGNKSPFSGSPFEIGKHLIDLEQLATPEFSSILSSDTAKSVAAGNKSDKVNYNNILSDFNTTSPHDLALRDAFDSFKALPETDGLKTAYNDFLKEDSEKVDRYAAYDMLSYKNKTNFWPHWKDDTEKNLFKDGVDSNSVLEKVKKEKDGNGKEYGEEFEFSKFCQFVADKQQKDSTKILKETADMDVAGDLLIGFSQKDFWCYRKAFKENMFLGVGDRDNEGTRWNLPVLNLDEINNPKSEASKLFDKKLNFFFDRYKGARIDAAWQLMQPRLYSYNNIQDYYRDPGAASKKAETKSIDSYNLGDSLIRRIENVAKSKGIQKNKLFLELLGGPVDMFGAMAKGRTQIQHSVYQPGDDNSGWGSVKYYKKKGLSEDEFIFGTGTHDDDTIQQIYRTKKDTQGQSLANNLGLNANKLKNNLKDFVSAKFAEIFTAKNNFFMAFDALGIDERFNTQDPNKENWSLKVPTDYEKVYHQNLIKGTALNTPESLAIALKAKKPGLNQQLIEQLNTVAGILKQDGALTEEDANKQLGENIVKF